MLPQSDRAQRIPKVAQHQWKRLQTRAEVAEESDRCSLVAKILPCLAAGVLCSICFRVLAAIFTTPVSSAALNSYNAIIACAECIAVAVWFRVVAPSFSATNLRAKAFRFFAHVG